MSERKLFDGEARFCCYTCGQPNDTEEAHVSHRCNPVGKAALSAYRVTGGLYYHTLPGPKPPADAAMRAAYDQGAAESLVALRAATTRAEEAERDAAWRAHERDSEAKRVGMHMKRAAAAKKRIGELEAAARKALALMPDDALLAGTSDRPGFRCMFCDWADGNGHDPERCPVGILRALTPTTGGE